MRSPFSYCQVLLAVMIATGMPFSAAAQSAKTMRLASLEWIPYVGPTLEGEGLSVHIVATAARQFGSQAKIDYFPWTRAMQLGTKDPSYAGYFPAYHTEERTRTCHFSAPIGTSTVGFAYLKSAPLRWETLQDMRSKRIAVVSGFSNGSAFDDLVKQGKLQVDPSPNDMLNLRKLLAGRVDTVVIDKLVLRYLLLTEPSLASERSQIGFHERPLAALPLHVCFQKSPEGLQNQQAFNRALTSMHLRKIENDYFHFLERKLVNPGP
jgi:polar amino acid transport system substrate-binding protein